jgi:DNA-directed RNA polymerase specialized sigma24 family protein
MVRQFVAQSQRSWASTFMSNRAELPEFAPADRDLLLRLTGQTADRWPDVAQEASELLAAAVSRLARSMCYRGQVADQQQPLFAARLWRCLAFHAPSYLSRGGVGLAGLVDTAEHEGLITGCLEGNLLMDVMLAQALELNQAPAAERFDIEFQPRVDQWALRMRGERGVDLIENFRAELILTREASPPRIAGYHGRTSFVAWLKTVVANFLVSHGRKRVALTGTELPEACVRDEQDPERAECGGLLEPLLPQAIASIDHEAIVLLKQLLIDNVPQHVIAARLNKNSGTITRRREKAVAAILESLRELTVGHARSQQVAECLDLLLAGEDRDLSQRLGKLIPRTIVDRAKEVS